MTTTVYLSCLPRATCTCAAARVRESGDPSLPCQDRAWDNWSERDSLNDKKLDALRLTDHVKHFLGFAVGRSFAT